MRLQAVLSWIPRPLERRDAVAARGQAASSSARVKVRALLCPVAACAPPGSSAAGQGCRLPGKAVLLLQADRAPGARWCMGWGGACRWHASACMYGPRLCLCLGWGGSQSTGVHESCAPLMPAGNSAQAVVWRPASLAWGPFVTKAVRDVEDNRVHEYLCMCSASGIKVRLL